VYSNDQWLVPGAIGNGLKFITRNYFVFKGERMSFELSTGWVRGLAAVVVCWGMSSAWLIAQEAGKKEGAAAVVENADDSKVKGRLPAYYKEVVDAQQRDKIYALQADYAAKIAPLQEQIKKLVADRDAAIEKVLTAEQQAKLKKIRDDVNAKRKTAGLGPATKEATKKVEGEK
jgi:hypothetical protein